MTRSAVAAHGAGRRFGPFITVSSLPSSNFGDAYLATRARVDGPDEMVFLKVARPFQLQDPVLRERFLREARRYAEVHDDHVVRFVDCGEQDGVPWIALEYLEGETLARRVARLGPSVGLHTLKLLVQLLEGLHAIASGFVVHRDLHPGNVLVAPRRGAVILDLGFAWTPSEDALSTTGEGIGHGWFVAPEQRGGTGRAATPAADVYAWAATAVYAVSGELPTGFKVQSLVDQGVPRDLAELLAPCLSPDPSLRPLLLPLRDNMLWLRDEWQGRWATRDRSEGRFPTVVQQFRWEQEASGLLCPAVDVEPTYAWGRTVRSAWVDPWLFATPALVRGRPVVLERPPKRRRGRPWAMPAEADTASDHCAPAGRGSLPSACPSGGSRLRWQRSKQGAPEVPDEFDMLACTSSQTCPVQVAGQLVLTGRRLKVKGWPSIPADRLQSLAIIRWEDILQLAGPTGASSDGIAGGDSTPERIGAFVRVALTAADAEVALLLGSIARWPDAAWPWVEADEIRPLSQRLPLERWSSASREELIAAGLGGRLIGGPGDGQWSAGNAGSFILSAIHLPRFSELLHCWRTAQATVSS